MAHAAATPEPSTTSPATAPADGPDPQLFGRAGALIMLTIALATVAIVTILLVGAVRRGRAARAAAASRRREISRLDPWEESARRADPADADHILEQIDDLPHGPRGETSASNEETTAFGATDFEGYEPTYDPGDEDEPDFTAGEDDEEHDDHDDEDDDRR